MVEKIKTIESRVEPMDDLNLATAITKNADVFVTIDSILVENKKLESVRTYAKAIQIFGF